MIPTDPEALDRSRSGQSLTLFDTDLVAAVEIDPLSGAFRRHSPSFLRLLGYGDGTQPESLREIIHPEAWTDAWNWLQDLIQGLGGTGSLSKRCLCKDGSSKWIKLDAQTLRDPFDHPISVIATASDASDAKNRDAVRLAGELRLHQLIDLAPLSVLVANCQGQIVAANRAWEKLWGVTVNEIPDFNLLTDEQMVRLGLDSYCRRAISGESVEIPAVEFLIERGKFEGQVRSIRSFAHPVTEDRVVKQIIVMQEDMTDQKHSEEALRASEARFRALFEASRDAIAVTEGLRHAYVNPAYLKMFGFESEDEVIGQPIAITLGTQVRDKVLARARRRLEGKSEPTEYETIARRRNGEEFPATIQASVFEAGGKKYSLVQFRDVGARKRAEEALQEQTRALELIIEIGSSLTRELDQEKLVQKVTEIATELTGAQFGSFFYNVNNPDGGSYLLYTLAGIPKSAFEDFPMPRDTPIFHPTFAGLGPNRFDDVTQAEEYGKNPPYFGMPTGHPPVRSFLGAPVISGNGEVVGGLFFGHEKPGIFTEQHEALMVGVASQAAIAMDNARLYHRLRTMNAGLERRVDERTRELLAANRELEGFTYSVSHDLRAPLRAIVASCMILREDFGDLLPPSAKEQLQRQAQAAKKMGTLIDDLLKLSRLGRQELRTQDVDVSLLTQEIVAELEYEYPKITFQIEEDLHALGDSRLLKLVLWNLLENAVKFSPNGGVVTFGKDDRGFFVRDQGIGFDMAYASKLFQPFERLHRDEEYPGTGIGLANVQRIVQRHGGQVWGESTPGAGAAFYFTLSAE